MISNQLWLCSLILLAACETDQKQEDGSTLADDLDFDGDGFTEYQGDCNDFNDSIHPEATELPADGIDQNCDGIEICYEDDDQDGYGGSEDESPRLYCNGPSESNNNLDCNDDDATINPDAVEICDFDRDGNAIDNDCDGLINKDDDNLDTSSYIKVYRDSDGDNYGVADDFIQDCEVREGYALAPTDCDDTDPEINPGQPEICDDIDNDCDGLRDAEDDNLDVLNGGGAVYYKDFDQDGEGDPNQRISACAPPTGYVTVGSDCDDSSPLLNTQDADFDGLTTCPNPSGLADCDDSDPLIKEIDDDGDGFLACVDDCDDTDPNINPLDNDGDGLSACAGDCDDTDPAIGIIDEDGDGFSACFVDCVDEPNDYDNDGAPDGFYIYPGAAVAEPYLCTQDYDGDGYGNLFTSCFVVQMLDTFSDGWNGGGLDFYSNGEFYETVTLSDGGYGFGAACLPSGDVEIQVRHGEYPEEMTFVLLNHNLFSVVEIGDVTAYSDGATIYTTQIGESGSDCRDQNYAISPVDNDGDGLTSCDYDCNDNNSYVGQTDADGDGYIDCKDDCDSSTSDFNGDGIPDGYHINPGATEIWYDGVDQNCDNLSDYDQDRDGDPIIGVDFDNDGEINTYWDFDGDGAVDFAGGTDCDDEDPEQNGKDKDNDGFTTCDDDCNDNNPNLYYGSAPNTDPDECYIDADGDGYGYGLSTAWYNAPDINIYFLLMDSEADSWEDAELSITLNSTETFTDSIYWEGELVSHAWLGELYPGDLVELSWTKGTDDDDIGLYLYDDDGRLFFGSSSMDSVLDGEMFFSFEVGWYLFDCDETDANIHPDATEIPGNGIDENCDGYDSVVIDNDGDGFSSWVDCDDNNANIYPSADEIFYDGIDSDCLPFNDDDADGDFQESNNPNEDGNGILGYDCDDSDEYTFFGAAEHSHPLSCMTDFDEDGFAEATSDVCYHLRMQDSYGDGWNGAYILLEADGTPFESGLPDWNAPFHSFTTPADSFYTENANTILDICAPAYTDISLEYVSGSYDIENSYVIYDDSGNILFSDGPEPQEGQVTSFTIISSNDYFDCDDDDGATYPGAAENESWTECLTDNDGDGWGPSDCDDDDYATHPGAAENESLTACLTDADGDGYGAGSMDCDDENPNANTGQGCPPQ